MNPAILTVLSIPLKLGALLVTGYVFGGGYLIIPVSSLLGGVQ